MSTNETVIDLPCIRALRELHEISVIAIKILHGKYFIKLQKVHYTTCTCDTDVGQINNDLEVDQSARNK